MTDRDELVREAADAVDHMKVMSDVGRKYRLPDDSLDSLAEYADRYAAMAARIEVDSKLIAEIERKLTALATALHAKHYPEVRQWRAATGDPMLLIDQIDNMTTALARHKEDQ